MIIKNFQQRKIEKGLPNRKKYLLVVQDMELVSREESERAWKHKMTPDILRHLYHILDSGYASIAVTQNIAHTKYGTFSCIDTEFGKRKLKLKKLNSREHNIHDRLEAVKLLYEARTKGELLTGLFYINEKQDNLVQMLNLGSSSLASLKEKDCRGTEKDFKKIVDSFR